MRKAFIYVNYNGKKMLLKDAVVLATNGERDYDYVYFRKNVKKLSVQQAFDDVVLNYQKKLEIRETKKKIAEVKRLNPKLKEATIKYRMKKSNSLIDIVDNEKWTRRNSKKNQYFVVENGQRMKLFEAIRFVSNNTRGFTGSYFKYHKKYDGLDIQECYELWKKEYLRKWSSWNA